MPRRRPVPAPTHSYSDRARGVRIQKVLAEHGVASRRRCEELVESGAVTVNGETVAALPAWVDPLHDRIEVEGRVVFRGSAAPRPGWSPAAAGRKGPAPTGGRERSVVVMLNKPRGTVCTSSDPEGRPRAIDLVQMPGDPRLYSVGRLDMDSSGLLLLTNDGDLANLLTHPRYEVHKGYEVLVAGRLTDEEVARLEQGVFLHERPRDARSAALALKPGRKAGAPVLELIRRDRDRTHLYMELREGRNRQVRRMMLTVGHPVKRLKRVRMGPLELKGLAIGEWRELTAREVRLLRDSARAASPDAAPAAGRAARPAPPAAKIARAANEQDSATPRRRRVP